MPHKIFIRFLIDPTDCLVNIPSLLLPVHVSKAVELNKVTKLSQSNLFQDKGCLSLRGCYRKIFNDTKRLIYSWNQCGGKTRAATSRQR